ncbi:hypothetical protein DL764_003934 [Monosporascus ibericus]|uniref:Uncharacterized protein n=1 Tax=Monosporascus ibericus TaxID=155417 RepID=A0A4Q4TJ52_9PEZI|nr:hypothetical protein DL764_003934 [Monosporascus ibericus]
MVSLKSTLVSFGVLLGPHIYPSLAFPFSNNITVSQGYPPNYEYDLLKRAGPRDFYLRIMPLGASITAGEHEPADDLGKNGYRMYLRNKLRFEGWKVNMVGNFNRGNMNDNDHEGVSGDRVSQVNDRAQRSVAVWLPNVILINAGTNDATQNGAVESVSGTGARMRQMIDGLFSHVPTAVVVLSTLLPNGINQGNVDLINDQYRKLYREYIPLDADGNEPANPAFKVVLADMADGFITMDDIHDGTHPTVLGEQKMAAVWDWAIAKANDKGWITKPTDSSKFSDGEGSTDCRKQYGSGKDDPRGGRQVLYASNSVIRDDGTYKHASRPRPDRRGIWVGDKDLRVWFAQLVNHGAPKLGERDEAIYVTGNYAERLIHYSINDGDGKYRAGAAIDVKDGCLTRGIHWGDVNGDGLDDFICIARDGEMFVSLNEGGNPPTFRNLGSYKKPEMGLGQDNVRLGDIDGDGRLDYCVIPDYGDIFCWRNGGLGEKAAYWQDMGSGGPIFKAIGKGDIKGVRFVDLNGDGRDDWIWMDTKGKVTTYINQRDGTKGMIPKWLPAGDTHFGMGVDIGDKREHVTFGRIFGDNGRHDYVHWDIDNCNILSNGPCEAWWLAYENQGSGGKYQKGDGIRWGDMTGTGVDDYVWIYQTGEVQVFLNKNTKAQSDYYATPAWSSPFRVDTGLDWRGLHVGDWDGDGMADIIGITDRNTGSLRVWHSRWDGSNFNWDVQDIPDSAKCDQGWGLLYSDHGAHFADISKTGRVDYLCMEPSGRTTAWLRDENGGWFDAGQVKFTEDLDRANFRFADADGDGRADLIWTDKFSGDGKVWYNKQQGTDADRPKWGGSLFEWERPVTVYLGSSRGPNMHFPNLGGQGRADMVGTDPSTGHAWIWFNSCPAGGDDGEVTNPGLPVYTPAPIEPNPSPDHWFCDGNGGAWTPGLWNNRNIGRWLYNGLRKDNAWNWPGPGCIDIADTCDLDESDLKARPCRDTPERAFSLFAMRNHARFLQRWYSVFMDSVDTADLFTSSVATTFLSHSPTDSRADEASWLTIASGMFTAVGAFLPVGGGGPNYIAGVLTVGAGAAGLAAENPPADPRFDNFSELQKSLGNMKLVVADAITKYFNRLLTETPPDNDWGRGTQLARALESGVFADQGFATGKSSINVGVMTRLIRASIISEAWNMGSVVIVKWSSDSYLSNKFKFNPCFGGNRWGMDHAVACQFNKNYMIARQITNKQDGGEQRFVLTFPKIGQDEDSLKKFDLDHAKVITAAEKTQERTKSFRHRGIHDLESLFQGVIEDPSDDILRDLTYFNVPVCDLDMLGDLDFHNCREAGSSEFYTKSCLGLIFALNCQKLKIGGSEWPYKYDI